MKFDCPQCGRPTELSERDAGRTIRCGGCGKSFVAPEELATVGRPHSLSHFPVASLVLLHYVTAGLFSIVYLNLLHDRMPRLRRDDPSATVAIGLCFVPIFNLYWFFFSYHRLCLRINEQRRLNGLPETAPQWLSIPVCALLACGLLASLFTAAGMYVLGTVGAVAMPVFAALVQHSINELCAYQHARTAAAI